MASREGAKEERMSKAAKILPMEAPRPAMGWQIEYEIYYGKKPEDHPPVNISVSMEDSIHWFCRDQRFRVVSVRPISEDAPAELFYRRFPQDNLEFANHVNSGPARPGTGNHYIYKPVFEFDDEKHTKLDPHIKTNP
jgi:hypothetical protein